MKEFYDRVSLEIKKHFPNAEIKKILSADDENLDWLHKAIRHDPPFGSAEDMVIDSLGDLRFLREPKLVFIRFIESCPMENRHSGMIVRRATLRFGMGYEKA